MKTEPHLSISQLNSYLSCSQKYYYNKILKADPLDTSANLILGSAYHKSIEEFYKTKQQGSSIGPEDMQSIFESYVLEEEGKHFITYGAKTSRENEFNIARGLWPKFIEGQDNFEIVEIENGFKIDFEDLPIPVLGIVDLILYDKAEDTLIISDFKTAAKKPSTFQDKFVLGDVDANLQLTLYQMYIKRKYNPKNIKLRLDYLIKSKSSPAYIKYPTERTEDDEKHLVNLFKKVYNHIELVKAQVIDPLPNRSFMCNGCQFRHLCSIQKMAA